MKQKRLLLAALLSLPLGTLSAQSQATPPAAPPPAVAPVVAPIERRDPALDAASALIGRALFLRCFCGEDNLQFDTQGKLQGQPKIVDWTLAGVNVQKVERRDPNTVQMEGVRVAIHFATDRREFDRQPLKDEKVKILLADARDPKAIDAALKNIFSFGIDRPLQQAMPDFWQHYFEPQKDWADNLKGQTIYVPGAAGTPAGLVGPSQTHKVDAGFTSQAAANKIQGTMQVRMVVDTTGAPHRVTIVQPLGYGLDARAAEAAEKFRFSPGTLDGKPVDAAVLINQQFELVPVPGH